MSIQSLRQRAGRALMALSLGASLGLGALQLACAKNDSSYEHPAPAISSFQVSQTNSFPTDPTKRKTAESIAVGGSVWCLANFGAKDGSATVAPGNIPVTSNVPFQITNITTSTIYTLTVTSGDGQKTTATISVTVLTVPSGLVYANEDATYYVDLQIPSNGPTAIVGSAPITYSVDPALPAGLVLDANTGIITGTPQVSTPQAAYTVKAANTVGSTTRPLKITVAATPLTFGINPTAIYLGSSAILSWDASSVPGVFSAVTISANPADATLGTGPFSLSGTKNVSPIATTTYTLTATPANGGAPVIRNAGVTVGPAPVTITSFSYAPTKIFYGGSTTLSWSYTGLPDVLTLNGANALGSLSADVTPLRRQSFTLVGSNNLGGDTRTIKVPSKGLHHIAGSFSSGRGNVDGGVDALTGFSTARFYRPNAVVWDEKANDGTMVVADYSGNLVRRITPDRKVTTIAGTPGLVGNQAVQTDTTTLLTPRNMAVDPVTGDIYVGGEGYTIKRLLKLAPNGDGTYTPSLVAGFTLNTNALVIDANRMMYFVEFSASAGNFYTMDLTSASPAPTLVANLYTSGVSSATAMARDFSGGRKLLYVVCSNKVMKIDLSGASPVATLFAGTGTAGFADNASAASGLLRGPQGVSADTTGNVYIADRDNFAVRMVPASGPLAGALITIAGRTGTAGEGYASSSITLDGTANLPTSTTACLSNVYYVLAQGDGAAGSRIFVADAGAGFDNQAIRVMTVSSPSAGQLTYTLDDPSKPAGYAHAGSPRVVGYADGVGVNAKFTFGNASGANLATLPDGSLTFAADTVNNLVRVIASDGTVTTLKDATATNIAFSTPKSVAVQVNPTTKALVALFVGDTGATKKLRKFTPNGDGTFTEAVFTVSGGTYPASPNHAGLAVDSTNGLVYATDATLARVFRIDPATGVSSDFVAAPGTNPTGIAVAANGSVWVSVTGASQVKCFDASGALLLTVGTGTAGWADGSASTAQFAAPIGIATAGSIVYVANYTGSQTSPQNGIRAIDAVTGDVTTLLGAAASTTNQTLFGLKPGYLNPDNTGNNASKSLLGAVLYGPQGLSANADGDLMVSTPHSVYQVVAPANQ
ncbi:putative Ig domain-containing protein [Geothrix paludis]|uniref:putative Ig domain-containing protein n=1 Tax=Geothrix paludis TaxID=2922722 RepID=UPI001FAD64BA|nr:putative Ig domain-containing protein [Geothrix paludis]